MMADNGIAKHGPSTASTLKGCTIGRYEVIARVGTGAAGEILRAFDPLLERDVAIKVVHDSFSDEIKSEYFQRFRTEARLFGRMSHPHVVAVYDAGTHANAPYLVMELCTDPPLDQLLGKNVRLEPKECWWILSQLGSALAHVHSHGVVHRDLKPSNVLSHQGVLKLCDFGVARPEGGNQTLDGSLIGTPCYMAPEQVEGSTVDERADLYSLGVIFYQLLAGRRPFEGNAMTVLHGVANKCHPKLAEFRPELGNSYDAFFEKALNKDPNKRFASALEFLDAVNLLEPEPTLTVPAAFGHLLLLDQEGQKREIDTPPQSHHGRIATPSFGAEATLASFGQPQHPQVAFTPPQKNGTNSTAPVSNSSTKAGPSALSQSALHSQNKTQPATKGKLGAYIVAGSLIVLSLGAGLWSMQKPEGVESTLSSSAPINSSNVGEGLPSKAQIGEDNKQAKSTADTVMKVDAPPSTESKASREKSLNPGLDSDAVKEPSAQTTNDPVMAPTTVTTTAPKAESTTTTRKTTRSHPTEAVETSVDTPRTVQGSKTAPPPQLPAKKGIVSTENTGKNGPSGTSPASNSKPHLQSEEQGSQKVANLLTKPSLPKGVALSHSSPTGQYMNSDVEIHATVTGSVKGDRLFLIWKANGQRQELSMKAGRRNRFAISLEATAERTSYSFVLQRGSERWPIGKGYNLEASPAKVNQPPVAF